MLYADTNNIYLITEHKIGKKTTQTQHVHTITCSDDVRKDAVTAAAAVFVHSCQLMIVSKHIGTVYFH